MSAVDVVVPVAVVAAVIAAAFSLASVLAYFAQWAGSAEAEAHFEVMGYKKPGDPLTQESAWARSFPGYRKMVARERRDNDIVGLIP